MQMPEVKIMPQNFTIFKMERRLVVEVLYGLIIFNHSF